MLQDCCCTYANREGSKDSLLMQASYTATSDRLNGQVLPQFRQGGASVAGVMDLFYPGQWPGR